MTDYVNTFNDIETVEQSRGVKKVFTAFVIIICCLILASAHPLSVAAAEDEGHIPAFGVAIAEMMSSELAAEIALASLGAAGIAALGGASLPVVIGVAVGMACISMGAALTIQMIANALNQAYDNGYFSTFLSKIVDGLNNGKLTFKGKLIFGAAILVDLYDWVKEHIVGYFNERVEVSVPDGTLKGFNNTNSDLVMGSYTFTGNEFVSNEGVKTLSTITETYTNSVTNNKYIITADLKFNSLSSTASIFINYTIHDVKNNIDFVLGGGTRGPYDFNRFYNNNVGSVCTIKMPFISDSTVIFPVVITNVYNNSYMNNGAYGIGNISFSIENNTYYINYISSNSGIANCYYNGREYYFGVEKDSQIIKNFWSLNKIIYYLLSDNVRIFAYYSGVEISSSSYEINCDSYKTTNSYYKTTNDILNTVSETLRGKVSSGDITNQSEGTISLGVSDVYSGALTDGLVDSLAITDLASITELNATDIVTNNVVVLEADTITSLPIALKVAADNIRVGTVDLKYKFPFDVIYSVSTWLQALVTEGEPLVIDYDFTVPLMSEPMHVHIDFGRYQTLVTVGNWVVLVSVAIGCLLASKKAIEAI